MKKICIPLIAAATMTFCGSCNSTNITPIERRLNITEAIELNSYKDLNLMLSQNQSFVLTTYSRTCFCSIDFYEKILNPIIKEYQIVVYKISEKEFANVAGLPFKPSTPEIVIYKNGEIVNHVGAYDKWENKVENKNKVVKFISKYFNLNSPLIICTKEEIENLIKTNSSILVYFKLKTCPDCVVFEELYLNEFLNDKNNSHKIIYAIETSEYRTQEDESVWQNFVNDFKLSYESSNEFGYLNGKVPTLQYYNQGELKGSVVIFNDEFQTNEHNSSITVTNGYYNQFNGMTFNDKNDYREQTIEFYSQKFIELVSKVYQ